MNHSPNHSDEICTLTARATKKLFNEGSLHYKINVLDD